MINWAWIRSPVSAFTSVSLEQEHLVVGANLSLDAAPTNPELVVTLV